MFSSTSFWTKPGSFLLPKEIWGTLLSTQAGLHVNLPYSFAGSRGPPSRLELRDTGDNRIRVLQQSKYDLALLEISGWHAAPARDPPRSFWKHPEGKSFQCQSPRKNVLRYSGPREVIARRFRKRYYDDDSQSTNQRSNQFSYLMAWGSFSRSFCQHHQCPLQKAPTGKQ